MEWVRVPVPVAEIARDQWGMFTTAQARGVGVSAQALSRMVANGAADRLEHGVYQLAYSTNETDHWDLIRAAWLSVNPDRKPGTADQTTPDGVVVSGASAAFLYEIGDLYTGPFEFTSAERRQTQRPDIRFRRRRLPQQMITVCRGLPVTTIEQTIADVAAQVDLSMTAHLLADAEHDWLVDQPVLARLLSPVASDFGFAEGDGQVVLEHLCALAGVKHHKAAA